MKYPAIKEDELQALLKGAYDDDDCPSYRREHTIRLFGDIVGKEITSVQVANVMREDDQENDAILVVRTAYKFYWFICDGDCCSETWISDIFGFSNLKGKLLRVNELVLHKSEVYNKEDGRTRQEEDAVYGYRFTTELGTSVIAFRNSSNGYYGGSLEKYIPYTDDSIHYTYNPMTTDEFDIWQAD